MYYCKLLWGHCLINWLVYIEGSLHKLVMCFMKYTRTVKQKIDVRYPWFTCWRCNCDETKWFCSTVKYFNCDEKWFCCSTVESCEMYYLLLKEVQYVCSCKINIYNNESGCDLLEVIFPFRWIQSVTTAHIIIHWLICI